VQPVFQLDFESPAKLIHVEPRRVPVDADLITEPARLFDREL
jgi:hypothetical protein